MKTLFLLLAASATVRGEIAALSVRSKTPQYCNAVGGALFTFEEDMSLIRARFPNLALTPNPSYHGQPPKGSSTLCQASFEYSESSFGSGFEQHRFAIEKVVVKADNISLPAGSNLNSVKAKIELNVDVSDETSPVHYPVNKDRASSSLVDLQVDPGVAVDDEYYGDYEYTYVVKEPVYTACLLGRDYAHLNFDIDFSIDTDVGGASSPGWGIDLGLTYEKCEWTSADDDWGQVKINDWESCTFREANN
ncbi:hypothetical protein GGS20DRAFT_565659 [Poronia punctata]|nr:hypothetical protein GGS20DRAFT_565659 [Poronia punctata]